MAKVPSSGYTHVSASESHFPSPQFPHGLEVIIGTRMFEDLRMAHHAGRYGVVEETTALGPQKHLGAAGAGGRPRGRDDLGPSWLRVE